MRRLLGTMFCAILLLVLAACAQTPTPQPPTETPAPATDTPAAETPTPETPPAETPAPTGDVVAMLAAMDQFGALSQALEDADLVEKLKSDGPYTLLAPTDAAFAEVEGELLDDPDLLLDILLYHVVEGTLPMAEAVAQGVATSLLGDELTFAADGQAMTVNEVVVVTADVAADNGVVHVVETVLMPPSLGAE